MPSVVKPEFHPTLPDLVAPLWRRLPRWAHVALIAAVVLVLALLLARWIQTRGEIKRIIVRGPVAFNLKYAPDQIGRRTPAPGDELLLRTGRGSATPAEVVIRPYLVAPYRGDLAGTLPIEAARWIAAARRADRTFVLRGEGRASVNKQPGYQVTYQTVKGGRTWYGRRVLLFPDEPGVRRGLEIELAARRNPVTMTNPEDVGSSGPTKLPFRSLRFGTTPP